MAPWDARKETAAERTRPAASHGRAEDLEHLEAVLPRRAREVEPTVERGDVMLVGQVGSVRGEAQRAVGIGDLRVEDLARLELIAAAGTLEQRRPLAAN